MASSANSTLNVIDLGRMAYVDAYARQRQVHGEVVAGAPPTLLLVEHDPVITVSRRKAASQHLLADPQTLADLGIDVQSTDRGGDITYHGPGQLVAYPILRLNDYSLNVGRYMQMLEQIAIDTLAAFNITGQRDNAGTGVWVELKPQAACGLAKIAAIGVRISRGVSLHGLALNVTTNLEHFNTIIPCGLAGRSVTSLLQQRADETPTMDDVKHALVTATRNRLAAM